KVPIIVAINKIDLPEADPERVKRQLTEHGLVPEEWGGDTIYVLTSAVKGQGIENLLEMILLVAEVSELKANPDREARGTVIEAELDRGRGPVATVLVQKGTLRVGDCLVAGTAYGRVRAMINDEGGRVKEATPSMPVAVLGLSEVPLAGDKFQVVADEKIAREAALRNKELLREENLRHTSAVNLEDLFRRTEKERQLNVIVKADVQGTVEAVTGALRRLNTDEVTVNVIHGGVGSVTESDVMLARASGAIIIGFNVRPEPSAKKAAEMERVEVRTYRVIYDLLDDIRAAMEGLLEPELEEVLLGRAEVRAIFRIPKVGVVAGAYVKEGKLTNKAQV
ncbi:MAG: translation initiation factor IF-2, partial [Clostridia bacterium]|nr:translation initiation factor IF-2 [Clostridia bacterium]